MNALYAAPDDDFDDQENQENQENRLNSYRLLGLNAALYASFTC